MGARLSWLIVERETERGGRGLHGRRMKSVCLLSMSDPPKAAVSTKKILTAATPSKEKRKRLAGKIARSVLFSLFSTKKHVLDVYRHRSTMERLPIAINQLFEAKPTDLSNENESREE
jgi:hypothetical protein